MCPLPRLGWRRWPAAAGREAGAESADKRPQPQCRALHDGSNRQAASRCRRRCPTCGAAALSDAPASTVAIPSSAPLRLASGPSSDCGSLEGRIWAQQQPSALREPRFSGCARGAPPQGAVRACIVMGYIGMERLRWRNTSSAEGAQQAPAAGPLGFISAPRVEKHIHHRPICCSAIQRRHSFRWRLHSVSGGRNTQ